jgi:hypothetical protein
MIQNGVSFRGGGVLSTKSGGFGAGGFLGIGAVGGEPGFGDATVLIFTGHLDLLLRRYHAAAEKPSILSRWIFLMGLLSRP